MYLPFPLPGSIDNPVTEYLDSGETISQSPSIWAKSSTADDGSSLEVDLEHGKSDDRPVLVVPLASLCQAQLALAFYVARQNPTLSTAARLYTDSVHAAFPDIPKTVFTKNIATLLAKRIKKRHAGTSSTGDDGVSEVTPLLSSLTDVTSKTSLSKASFAYKQPVQETLCYNHREAAQPPKPMYSQELNYRKRIAILEAQLALSEGVSVDGRQSATSKASTRSLGSHSRSSRAL